jgi:bifunctional non-homologous end joining protein LigD
MPKKTPEIWELNGREIELTSLDRRYWPDDDLTKGDMLDYYRQFAPLMLPFLRERPLTLRVFPRGIGGPGYWRRERTDSAPDWLRSATYQPESRSDPIEVPLIDDAAGLIWYADHAAIEVHQWLSVADDLEHPDWAVFDLDPGEQVDFTKVLEAALRVRDELATHDLTGFAKTSGGVGLHVFVPLEPALPFETVREWVHGVAERLAEQHPDLIATASGGTHAGNKVTIDHAQNSIGRNTAAPYTLRARAGAPASAPVSWDEVEGGRVRPDQFTLKSMAKRVDKLGDLWADVRKRRQKLPVDA